MFDQLTLYRFLKSDKRQVSPTPASIFIHHQAEKLMRNYDLRENASIYLLSNSLNCGKSFRKYLDQTGELCVCVNQGL